MRKVAATSIPNFQLTPEEANIFQLLLKINQGYALNTTFRVAGGWVRDRLLGKESDDLDIALDNLTGRQFESYLSDYGRKNLNSGIGKSYLVEETPGVKLETVAVELFGRKIDFINLRTETYGDTRVPEMQFGTPEVDAQRRDLTINALFYNVNTGQIEDFVGGLEDLRTMTLRTPLDPIKTFMDDPLRMPRVLRFNSRYPNAKIDQSLINAMALPEVHEAYRQKVASERAGPELLKLLAGAKPTESLRILFQTGLDKAVFGVPEFSNLLDLRMDQRNKHHAYNLIDHTLMVVQNMHDLLVQENAPEDVRVKMLLAALMHDFGKAHPEIGKPKASDPTQMSYVGHEDKSAEISDAIMKSIGVPADDRNFVNKVIGLHMKPHVEEWSPKAIGKFMRDSQIPGQKSDDVWYYVMLHGIADEMSKGIGDPANDVALKRQHIEQMRNFKARPGPSSMKPILNGNELMQMFPKISPTTLIDKKNFIKVISDRLMDDQASGAITDKQQAQAVVEQMRPDIERMFGSLSAAWVHDKCVFPKIVQGNLFPD